MPENAHGETVPRETPTAKPAPKDRFLGLRITPIMRRRLANFAHNRRGFSSLWIFLTLFFLSLFAEFIVNDKPLLIRFDSEFYIPVFVEYRLRRRIPDRSRLPRPLCHRADQQERMDGVAAGAVFLRQHQL